MNGVVAFAIGYAVGSIPTGLWVGRLAAGIDVRQQGSGNLGATNVFRVLGWKAGVFTLVIDLLKGFLPAWLAYDRGLLPGPGPAALCAGLGAILGHTFSFWVRFRGGKGVATSAGVFLALLPKAMAIAVACFAACFAVTRIVSASSVFAALALMVATCLTTRDPAFRLMGILVPALIIVKHRSNLVRIFHGTEPRLGSPRKEGNA